MLAHSMIGEMSAVWLRASREMRAHWRATVVLALLVALIGGMVLAAGTGARRTATALDRLRASLDGRIDVQILDITGVDLSAIEGVPGVERTALVRYLVSETEFDLTTSTDQLFASQLVEGSIDPADPLAAVINGVAARGLGVEVGDLVDFAFYSAAQWEAQDPTGGPQGPHVTIRIAGLVKDPDEIDAADPGADASLGSNGAIALPQSFLDRYGDELGVFTNQFLSVQLRDGRDAVPEFKSTVRALPNAANLEFLDAEETQSQASTARTVRLQAWGLAVLAAALALAGVMTIGQILVRQFRSESADAQTLGALGLTTRQQAMVGLIRGAAIGVVGATLTVAGAVAWSPLTPFGLAREAEPHPGVEVNVTMLAAGWLAIALTVSGAAALTMYRVARRETGGRPVATGEAAGRRGPINLAVREHATAPLSVALALTAGTRASRLAARATTLAMCVAVATIVVGSVLIASLDRITDRPERFGWTFDAVAGNPFEEDPGELFDFVDQTSGVEAIAGARNITLEVNGDDVGMLAIEAGSIIGVPVLEGRAPTSVGEVAVGRRTLDVLDVDIGDRVTVATASGSVDVTVTGTVIVPEVGGTAEGLGDGGVLTLEGLSQLAEDAQPNLALLRFSPGQREVALESFRALSNDTLPIVEPYLPLSLYQFVRIRSFPLVLSLVLATLALATLVHTLIGVGRTRRREFAVLSALGFTRSQMLRSTLWQATFLAVVALVVGLPLGIIGGRLGWAAIERRLGIPDEPAVPVVVLLLLVPAAVAAVNVVAALPGWFSVRRQRSWSRGLHLE
jgi:FtsX-like permease family